MAIIEFTVDPDYAAFEAGPPPPLYPEGYVRPAGLASPFGTSVPSALAVKRSFASRQTEGFGAFAARVLSECGAGAHTARIRAAQAQVVVTGGQTAHQVLNGTGFDVEVV